MLVQVRVHHRDWVKQGRKCKDVDHLVLGVAVKRLQMEQLGIGGGSGVQRGSG